MNNADLYSLPKDMLVKLICTIREDAIKEVTSEYEEKIEKMENKLKLYKKVVFLYCHEVDCDKKSWKGADEIEDEFFYCENCEDVYCESHIVYRNGFHYCKYHG